MKYLIVLMSLLVMNVATAGDPELLDTGVDLTVKRITTDSVTVCRTPSWLRDMMRLAKAKDEGGVASMLIADKCLQILPMEEITFFGILRNEMGVGKFNYQGRNVYTLVSLMAEKTEMVQ